jgi:beta-xylosidase
MGLLVEFRYERLAFYSAPFSKTIHHVYDDLCAPAVWVQGDTLLVFGSTYSRNFPIWMSTNPKAGEWKEAIDSLDIGGWDPDFFVDDDGKALYVQWK